MQTCFPPKNDLHECIIEIIKDWIEMHGSQGCRQMEWDDSSLESDHGSLIRTAVFTLMAGGRGLGEGAKGGNCLQDDASLITGLQINMGPSDKHKSNKQPTHDHKR